MFSLNVYSLFHKPHVTVSALVTAFALAGCETIPVEYAPASPLSAIGTVDVTDFV